MGVNAEITRQLENNTVQVDITSKKARTRYFQVPKQKAAAFADKYKKQDKQITYFTNTVFFASVLGGVLLSSALTRKIVKSKAMQFILGSMGGIGGGIASVFASGNYIDNKQKNLLKEYQAKEIFYEA